MSNSLDPDQLKRFVEPHRYDGHDMGPNCLQKLSADDTGRQSVNILLLLCLCICLCSNVHNLFLMVPWVCLSSVIVVVPGHTYLFRSLGTRSQKF